MIRYFCDWCKNEVNPAALCEQRITVAFGTLTRVDPQPVDGDTEASVSKHFDMQICIDCAGAAGMRGTANRENLAMASAMTLADKLRAT